MQIVFVTPIHPEIAVGGSAQRAASIHAALLRLGDVHIQMTELSTEPQGASPGGGGFDKPLFADEARVGFGPIGLKLLPTIQNRAVQRWLFPGEPASANEVDVVWYFKLGPALHHWTYGDVASVTDFDDLNHELVEGGSTTLGALHARATRQSLRRLESIIARRSGASVVCSERAATEIARMGGRPHVIPNVAPVPVKPKNAPSNRRQLVMTGRFGYGPNLQGARWFLDHVWPLLDVTGIEVVFAGLDSDRLLPTETPGITGLGPFREIGDILTSNTISIAPLLMGSGTRVKILEAFAQGSPVVATAVAADGLEVQDGEHLLIADDPADFAAACTRLLGDPGLGARLAENALELVQRLYSQPVVDRAVAAAVAAALAQPVTTSRR